MSKKSDNRQLGSGLLPEGISDVMPADAMARRSVINTVMDSFVSMGYAQVSPPMIEYEETLLAEGPGAALADNTFRLMDPITRRMLAIRSDMTAQIARIAITRMKHLPRPLRLAYHGQVLRIKPDPLNPERQLAQVGAELIGANAIIHDAEVAVVAVESLRRCGVETLSIDLNVPRLLDALLDGEIDAALRSAVAAKDIGEISRIAPDHAAIIGPLLDLSLVKSDKIKDEITGLSKNLPRAASAMLADLLALAEEIIIAAPFVQVTMDPLEQRGFDYHQGVGFSIFAKGVRGEIGRGGRYRITTTAADNETSTGVTLYLERVLRCVPPGAFPPLVYIPQDRGIAALIDLTSQGHQAIMGGKTLGDGKNWRDEAQSFEATHYLDGDKVKSIS